MTNKLLTQLSTIRHKVRLALWVRGICCLLAAMLGLLFVACLGDWLFHFDDPGVRLIFGLVTLAGSGWVAWRYLVKPLQQPLDNQHLASHVEQRFPIFQDSFASSVSFLEHQTDSRSGSTMLQQKVIDQTQQQAEQVDVTDILDTSSLRRMGLIAVGVSLFVGVIAGWNGHDATTAMGRLIFPFSDSPWSRTTMLQFVDEKCEPVLNRIEKIGRGETLELFVQNSQGQVPDDLTLEYQFGTDPLIRERMHLGTLTDREGTSHTIGTFLLTARKGPLKYRAVGGDDLDQPMQTVHVIPPPMVEELRVHLIPPAYTQKKPFDLPLNVGHVRALVGTRIEINIKTSKPLLLAELHRKGQPIETLVASQTEKQNKTERNFSISFLLNRSEESSYWFELTDTQQFKSHQPTHYDLQGIVDASPDIYIAEPSTDLSVTANATIPVRIVTKDDWGIQKINFVTQRRNVEKSQAIVKTLFTASNKTTEQTVSHQWQLESLQLSPGASVEFHAEVADSYDLEKAHLTRSIVRVLTIVSPEEKIEELIVREISLVDDLRRSFKMQQESHEHVLGLTLQLEQAGKLQVTDLDLLKRAELDQRQISSRLINSTDGIEVRAKLLQQEFKQNKIASPKMQNRLQELIAALAQLRQSALPQIDESLTHSRKNVETTTGDATTSRKQKTQKEKETLQALQAAGTSQQEVITTLGELLDEYSQWQNRQQLSGEINKLIEAQQSIISKTNQLGKQTFGKEQSNLTPQQRADLARLGQQQNRLAAQHHALVKRMEKMTKAKDANSSMSAVRDTLEEMNEQATESDMRQAAEHLQKNRIGQAKQKQQQILSELENSRNTLQNSQSDENEMLLKKMNQAADKLETLEKQQAELLQKRREINQVTDKEEREQQLLQLRKEEQALQKETSKQMRTLQRLRSRKASAALRRAALRMQQATDGMEQSDATDLLQEVLDDLQQSRRELARDQHEIQSKLMAERMEEFVEIIKEGIEIQKHIINQTKQLNRDYTQRKRWGRGLLKRLLLLEQVQSDNTKAIHILEEGLKEIKIISLSLAGVARNMERAGRLLSDRNTGKETIRFEETARRRLQQLARAIKTKMSINAAGGSSGGGGKTPQDEQPKVEIISGVKQLQVMKLLQTEILRRTTELNQQRKKNGTLTAEQTSELESLTEEQSQLTESIKEMLREYETIEAEFEEQNKKKKETPK